MGKNSAESLGEPLFDFYFGIAAIEAGHAGEGVLALERYLLLFPNNLSARMQLARGYFVLGEDAQAREEFEAIQKLNPPADVSATTARFLDAIRSREARYNTSTGLYVEVGGGFDSNVNSGQSGDRFVFGGTDLGALSATSRKLSSLVGTAAAGAYISHPVAPGIALFAAAQGERRFHDSVTSKQFEQGNYGLTGGASLLRDQNVYRASIAYGLLTIGSEDYRRTTSGSIEWQRQLDERQAFTLGGQVARLDYGTTYDTSTGQSNSAAAQDAEFYGLNAGYRRLFSHAWQPTLALGVNYGEQHSRSARPDLTPRIWGGSITASFTPAAKWGASVGGSYQQSDYLADYTGTFGDARHDKYHAVNGTLSYLYSPNLSIRMEALIARNNSNIEFLRFQRESLMFKLRYEIK